MSKRPGTHSTTKGRNRSASAPPPYGRTAPSSGPTSTYVPNTPASSTTPLPSSGPIDAHDEYTLRRTSPPYDGSKSVYVTDDEPTDTEKHAVNSAWLVDQESILKTYPDGELLRRFGIDYPDHVVDLSTFRGYVREAKDRVKAATYA
ncbi:hypothetical protein AAVH_36402, partial [Aphelenchoides avenae]